MPAAKRRRRPAAGSPGLWPVLLAGIFLAAGGCQQQAGGEQREIEVVDVPPPLTVDVEQDPQARPRKPELSGILPEGFPPDLPLHLPASLIDFGDGDGGREYVTLTSPDPRAKVRSGLVTAARRQGWSVDAGGGAAAGASTVVLVKGGRRVALQVDDLHPGTVYRIDYPPE